MTKKELQKVSEIYKRKFMLYRIFNEDGDTEVAKKFIDDANAIQGLMMALGYVDDIERNFAKAETD